MLVIALVFIFGLIVGSFLNVVIFRLHRQESFVRGYSKCLFCGHRLYAQDLVPLFSYIFLRGHCRYCRHRFSAQYPLVELSTAILFPLIFIKFIPGDWHLIVSQNILGLLFAWILTAFLTIIFVYDLKYYLILDAVVLPAIILALVFNLLLGANFINLFLAGLFGAGIFFLQFAISKGTWIGGGDIRLGFLMGAVLGWPEVGIALFLAYILGGAYSLGLLLTGKKHLSDKVAFGTFLSLATFITMLYGQTILTWYISLLVG
ncbi:MAG: prepilin peptidase [Patescibacteria group bacterium]